MSTTASGIVVDTLNFPTPTMSVTQTQTGSASTSSSVKATAGEGLGSSSEGQKFELGKGGFSSRWMMAGSLLGVVAVTMMGLL